MRHSHAIQNFFDDFAMIRPLASFAPPSAKPSLGALQKALQQMPQSRPRAMATDLIETGAGYEYHIEVPGFKKEEISIEVKDGILSVGAKKVWGNEATKGEAAASSNAQEGSDSEPKDLVSTATHTAPETGEAQKNAPTYYLHRERAVESTVRRYRLPSNTEAATVEAKFENGVLILSVQKKQEPVSTKIQIS